MPKEDFFTEENIPTSNWMQFNKVGDHIKGTLLAVSEKEAEGDFPAQKVYKLEVKATDEVMIDGEVKELGVWNVGISVNKSFVHDRLSRSKPGQKVGFKFVKEIPASTKGFSPAKSINPYAGEMDSEYEGDAGVEDAPFDA